MWKRFLTNLRTFLWAFALALAVWIAAVTAADPDEVRLYPTPIKIQIVGQDPSLVIRNEIPQQVQLTLRAPRSVWEQLMAHPDSLRAVLDLSGKRAGVHKASVQIQTSIRPVRVVTVAPSSFTLMLDVLATRKLEVALSLVGQPALGYQAGEATLQPGEVVIAGPQSLVSAVAQARLILNLDGARESISQSLPVEAIDQNNHPVNGLSIHPEQVQVNLPISQQGGFRDVAVKVIVRGQVASGYRLTNLSVFPPVVTVFSSNPTLINSLPGFIETQPLNLSGVKDDLTMHLTLNLPPGISVIGDPSVVVQAGVAPVESSLTLSGKIVEVVGLPQGMSAKVSPQTVDVILSGPLATLNTLSAQDVRVTVDVSGLGAGAYQLTPKVEVLTSSVRVESILPATVEVLLSLPGTPTPKP